MTARFLIGDVFDRMAELPDHSFDLITCSPPFLALRSYLPDGHPDKAKEIGSEPTPAVFIDTMLNLAAEWRRLLAPYGSIAIELGDTYAGSGGGGGDYDVAGLRDGQPRWSGSGNRRSQDRTDHTGGTGWPLPLSLCGIPQAFMLSLIYGYNVLDRRGPDSPAGQWRIRNEKPWIRTNPPVGALGGKERPATSYIAVACVARDRYFDLDAVRTPFTGPARFIKNEYPDRNRKGVTESARGGGMSERKNTHDGAPPRDWYHTVDAILDAELDTRAAAPSPERERVDGGGNIPGMRRSGGPASIGQARGHHLRRALERAGILTTLDAYDVSPKGYAGAHYAVWPPELVRLLVDEMCPRRVCTQCGEPSRRITGEVTYEKGPNFTGHGRRKPHHAGTPDDQSKMTLGKDGSYICNAPTLGWSDCGCEHCTCNGHDHRGAVTRCKFCPCDLADHWRPGRILDPFAGSGTTLAVATGMGRETVGIDIDERNALLASERVGMFLEIEDRPTEKEAS